MENVKTEDKRKPCTFRLQTSLAIDSNGQTRVIEEEALIPRSPLLWRAGAVNFGPYTIHQRQPETLSIILTLMSGVLRNSPGLRLVSSLLEIVISSSTCLTLQLCHIFSRTTSQYR